MIRQCRDAGAAAFCKQIGARPYDSDAGMAVAPHEARAMSRPRYMTGNGWARALKDPKGGDPAEWPEDIRVRQYPEARA